MNRKPLAFIPVSELVTLIKDRQLSPVELIDDLLKRINRLNPQINAYLTVAQEKARRAASAAEKALANTDKTDLPSLHGVPIAVKDLEFTRGIRTTGGSLAYSNLSPDYDAVIVERLKHAGAIVLGKTNTPEFGSYGQTWNLLGDDCRNPWDPERTSGGSSGGSAAAVAAGMAPIATGTDGAGSIRAPASFCGVYGFKPTFGLVPMYGGFLGLPVHTCPGPLSRTVRDAALVLSVIAGYDPRDPNSLRHEPPDFLNPLEAPPGILRIAWSPDLGFAKVDPEVASLALAAARACQSSGWVMEEASPPIDVDLFEIADPVRNADKFAAWGHLLETRPDDLTPYVRSVLERGKQVTGEKYSNSLRALERLKARMADFFDKYDLLLTPTTGAPAFPVREPPPTIGGHAVPHYASTTLMTIVWNLTGQPAASLPCGFTEQGLPVGLQVIGRSGDDVIVLRVSRAIEAAKPWADRLPVTPHAPAPHVS